MYMDTDKMTTNMANDTLTTESSYPLFGDKHKEHLLSSSETSHKRRRIFTFAAFGLIYFTMSASYSIIAPFFPNEALEKGASGVIVGLIFGIFALVTFIVSPIAGTLIPTVGPRFMLFSGLFITGIAEFLFGFLNKMPGGTTFIVYAFILRSFDGVGGALSMTACVASLAHCFPDNVGSVMGGLELFTGVGLTLGPFLGGILYEYGGFGLPFFVLAALILITLPIVMCILPPIQQERPANERPTTNVTILKLLKIPAFGIVVNTILICGIAIGILEPLLAPYLKTEFNVTSSTKIGLIFLFFCGGYALFAPLFGWLADRTSPRWVMTLGCFSCGIGFFLLGRKPFTFLPNAVWFVSFSMGLIGLSFGPCFVPAYAEMENIAKAKGFPDDIATHGIISGIFGAAYNIGAFLGPTCGGFITEYIHFSWTCTGFGVVLIVQSFFLLGLTLSGSSKVTNKTNDLENPSENSPLLVEQTNVPNIQTC